MAIRDLRVCADALSGSVSHFLDANGLECDAVIHLHGGFGVLRMAFSTLRNHGRTSNP